MILLTTVYEVGEQNVFRSIQNTAAEDAFWLGLQDKTWLIPMKKMVASYELLGSMMPLWNASYDFLIKMGIDDESSRKYLKYKEKSSVLEYVTQIKKLEAQKIKIIRFIDRSYPPALRNIENPPLLLLQKGELENLTKCIAIAGTRNPSAYGRIMSRKIAKYMAEHGYTIVSGLARGIDEWAHVGALEARKGKSIAVLAWMDPIYPEEHADLAADLQKRGAIIGEIFQQPFNKSAPARFVQRNRITSGISEAVVAVESDDEGGTVHQVKIAISQKRKVFAVQPQGNERAKRGFKLFVELGAIPVKTPIEIAETLKKENLLNSTRLDSYYQHSLDR